jgi:hypothetical protein
MYIYTKAAFEPQYKRFKGETDTQRKDTSPRKCELFVDDNVGIGGPTRIAISLFLQMLCCQATLLNETAITSSEKMARRYRNFILLHLEWISLILVFFLQNTTNFRFFLTLLFGRKSIKKPDKAGSSDMFL